MGFKRIARDGDIFKIEVDGVQLGMFEVINKFGPCSLNFNTDKKRVRIKHKKGTQQNVNNDIHCHISADISCRTNWLHQQPESLSNRQTPKVSYRRNKKGAKRD